MPWQQDLAPALAPAVAPALASGVHLANLSWCLGPVLRRCRQAAAVNGLLKILHEWVEVVLTSSVKARAERQYPE